MEKNKNISVIKDLNGKDIVLINDIKFKGKRSINWDDVKEYLKESVGEFYTILETGDVIYIGADLPDEYTGSNDTYGLKGTNAKAKANASQGIGEMIEIATDSKFIINKKDKHKMMRLMAGIDLIHVLLYRYLMRMEK